MIICGLDLETTGLDPHKDVITEIGAVLWDTNLNMPIKFFNVLIKIDVPVPEFIKNLTGITDELLQTHGIELSEALSDLRKFAAPALYSMAHNAPFDKGFLEAVEVKLPTYIDSSVDVPYPENIQTRKLTHLAAEHGFVNPFAHRAVTDVLTMMQVCSKYPWIETVTNAKTPNVALKAMVTFDNNHKAKGAGFRWEAGTKSWLKNIKENKVEAEIAKCLSLGFTAKKV